MNTPDTTPGPWMPDSTNSPDEKYKALNGPYRSGDYGGSHCVFDKDDNRICDCDYLDDAVMIADAVNVLWLIGKHK